MEAEAGPFAPISRFPVRGGRSRQRRSDLVELPDQLRSHASQVLPSVPPEGQPEEEPHVFPDPGPTIVPPDGYQAQGHHGQGGDPSPPQPEQGARQGGPAQDVQGGEKGRRRELVGGKGFKIGADTPDDGPEAEVDGKPDQGSHRRKGEAEDEAAPLEEDVTECGPLVIAGRDLRSSGAEGRGRNTSGADMGP